MHNRLELIRSLSRRNDEKIVLLVLDGLGDIRTVERTKTPLEAARTPHFDQLATSGALGRLVAASTGVTPGSGPGHLGLFGYDPLAPEHDIGRGVLEALGLGLQLEADAVTARGNFASIDEEGKITDRRAGRIPTSEGTRLVGRMREVLEERSSSLDAIEASVHPGEGYRFVLVARSTDPERPLSSALADTDPQRTGVPPRDLQPEEGSSERDSAAETARRLAPLVDLLGQAIADEERANGFTLRGFSKLPTLPSFESVYGLRAGAFAGYPLYRGVASACGMQVEECGKRIGDILDQVEQRWQEYDFFFLHVKQTDQAGEDGDSEAKTRVIEEVDATLPRLLALEPSVLAVTGDHSTPAPMKAHSWHPIPLLLHSERCGIDDSTRFDEMQCASGAVGTLPSADLMGLLMANAGKLAKFGA